MHSVINPPPLPASPFSPPPLPSPLLYIGFSWAPLKKFTEFSMNPQKNAPKINSDVCLTQILQIIVKYYFTYWN